MDDRISHFTDLLKTHYNEQQQKSIIAALNWARELHEGQLRASGEPYLIHPIRVAEILTEFNMDYEAIIGGLLHDIVEDTPVTLKEVDARFGSQVARLVDGVTKISSVRSDNKILQSSETIRKTLFAMTEDIRVIIIKLADKYHNMGTLGHLRPDKRKRIAAECLEIYAPLAERLGISWLKAELEDLSLEHLNPTAWQHINDNLALRRSKREEFLAKVENILIQQARKENLHFETEARAKHLYSIFLKMKKSKKDMDEMFDLLGVRLICSTIQECYTILGMVHSLWPPIEGRFKDYIAMPKANRYRSLHTTVMCFGGQLLEIQIRTEEMHAHAEFGVAAHWAYKKGLGSNRIKPEELRIINKLKGWNRDEGNSIDFLKEIKAELLKDSIYVFTPKGQIVELPKGATPLDFAYHIHTEVGDHCIGARSQSAMLPLNSKLRNTDVVEVLTSPRGRPNPSWLEIAQTTRAKSKIRHWLSHHQNALFAGDPALSSKATARDNETTRETPPGQQPGEAVTAEKPEGMTETESSDSIQKYFDESKLKIRVGDEQNMMIKMGGCCQPVPGDPIIGYVSRGRGIIVHRRECSNLAHIPEVEERLIGVEWATDSPKENYRFTVLSRKIPDLFSQIDSAIRKLHGYLIQGRVEENEAGNMIGSFLIELKKDTDFSKVKRSIRNIPDVLEIRPQQNRNGADDE